MQDVTNAVDNGHQASADGLEDAANLFRVRLELVFAHTEILRIGLRKRRRHP